MERKVPKHPKPSITLNLNDKRQVQQYSDVLRGTYVENNNGVQMSIQNTSGTISAGNTDGIHNNIPTTQTVAKQGKEYGNNTTLTRSLLNNFLESREFQETLAKIVAPQVKKQVSDIITPSVEKLDAIETQVKGLHDYVHDNKQWQNQQSNRQTDHETNVTTMSTTMNDMGNKIDKLVGLFLTNSLDDDGNPPGKRPIDSLSPEHHAKMNRQYQQKAKFNHSNNDDTETTKNPNTQDYQNGMTSPLTTSTFPSQPNQSDDEMQYPKSRQDEVGEGQ